MKPQLLSLGLIFLCLTGCEHEPVKTVAKPQPNAQTGQALDNAAAALDTLKSEQKKKSEVLAALIDSADEANLGNPDGVPKVTVANELSVARAANGQATPDPEAALAAAERRRLLAEGKAEEARQAYDSATRRAVEAGKALAEAQAKAEAELTGLRETINRMEREAQKANIAWQAERKAWEEERRRIQDEANRRVQMLQVRILNILGAVGLVAGGACMAIGGIAALRAGGWIAGVGGVACLGLAQLVSLWWFKFACGGALLLLLGGIGVSAWLGKRKEAAAALIKAKADEAAALLNKFKGVTRAVVPVLDDLYYAEDKDGQERLDKQVFDRLKDQMTEEERQLVHNVRGELSVKPQ
ncbi:MAG: hypothetical protein SFV32_12840 [Opitutaceae bacterium]|nr:hypothetical protein [Opitutaceae bacterium]